MIKLRQEQIKCLATKSWSDFAARVREHWRECFPLSVEGKEDGELDHIIDRECGRAREVGLRAERDLIRYLDTGALLGWGWQENVSLGWTDELHDPDNGLPPNARAEAIWNHARAEIRLSAT